MVAHLSMNTVIHAAVRRDLGRIAAALDGMAAGDRERATQIDRAWRFLDGQLQHHHHSEEELFWPALRELGVTEELVGDLDGEHQRMIEAMTFTRAALAAAAADPSAEHLADARRHVATLREVIDQHFAHEERDLEPISAGHADAPQMRRAASAVRRSQTLPAAAAFLAWLLDGADADARAYLQHEIPRPVLAVVPRLFGVRYHRSALAS